MLIPLILLFTPPAPITCVAIDGDGLHCRGAGTLTGSRNYERIRLLGIDAPEKPGSCRPGRHCAPGDPFASKASLARGLTLGPITIRRFGQDRYGRTLALVSAGGTDLSCWQLTRRMAIYRRDWDTNGALRSRCRI